MKAIVTGVSGQDGFFMAELLVQKGYDVVGVSHRITDVNGLDNRVRVITVDFQNYDCLYQLVKNEQPDEIYNFAAQSSSLKSWERSRNTLELNLMSVIAFLEGIRDFQPRCRFFQASSAEIFGETPYDKPQNENTKKNPATPYAVAKVAADLMITNFRSRYGIYLVSGIFFNHESVRRKENFLPAKIVRSVAAIKNNQQDCLYVGNINSRRDWGYAPDYMYAAWRTMQLERGDDYIFSTGETHSVRELIEAAFNAADMPIYWEGEGIEEIARLQINGDIVVRIDQKFYRTYDRNDSVGDSSKLRKAINWHPSVCFNEMIQIMTNYFLEERKMSMYTKIEKCRLCGNDQLKTIVNLGCQKLTGVFPFPGESVYQAPLELVKCDGDNTCGLVQLRHSCQSSEMYGMNYGYRSGLNSSMVRHLQDITDYVKNLTDIQMGDILVDIGANDGTLLGTYGYDMNSVIRVGIDPTAAKFKKYYQSGIKIVEDFFSEKTFKTACGENAKAKVITSIAMFYDLENPLDFAKQIASCLSDDGIWVFEQSYLPYMIQTGSFDTICQEHLEYYGMKQIDWIAKNAGLKIIDVDFNDINGGSFRITCALKDAEYEVTTKVAETLNSEEELGYNGFQVFEEFLKHIAECRANCRDFFEMCKRENRLVIGYGASTKGNVLLQYFNITTEELPYIAEVNADKFGRVTPGSNIPIISEKEAREMQPDYFFVLPWHFKDNILEKESKYMRDTGCRFVFALPDFTIEEFVKE